MEHNVYLKDILILLLTAAVVVSMFRWLRASAILGYLIGGLLIGPHALGFISDIEGTKLIAEFGVVFLLFTIGLKMPLQRFQVLKRYVFGLGFLQVSLVGCAIALAAYVAGVRIEASILIGSALALSSTAVVLQLLSERGELALRSGRVAFAVLLFQDLAVVLLLVLLSTFREQDTSLIEMLALSGVRAFVVLFLIILVGRLLLRPLYRGIVNLNNRELLVILTLLVVLLTSLATGAAGLSMELGAFLAGLLLSETEYRHQVEADIHPFYGLLLGLFFMTVGMSIDLSLIVNQFWGIVGIIAFMMVVKTSLLYFLCLLFKVPKLSSLKVSLLLAGGGEFVFVILIPAVKLDIIHYELSQIIFCAVAISMALTPFLAMLAKYIGERWAYKESDALLHAASDEIEDLKNHVIISGFGRVGQMIAALLLERMISFVAIDNNMEKVAQGRKRGFPVFYGDAQRIEVMRALAIEKARSVVISLNNTKATFKIAMMLRRQFPHIDVSVRVRDEEYEDRLSQAGVTVVLPENLEPSLQLASAVLRAVGTPDEEVDQVIEKFRKSYSLTQVKSSLQVTSK